MNDTVEHVLKDGLDALGLDVDLPPFLNYLSLLAKWNKVYNLTAVRNPEAMVIRHLLDSLAIHPWVHGTTLLDVGAGAGFPGIPLALAFPDLQITLIDSNGKKIRFLQEAQRVLSLCNINLVQSRVEAYQPDLPFDTVTSRAFSDLQQMMVWTNHLIAPKGIWLAMKGRTPIQELAQIKQPYTVNTYTVPGLNEERCSIIIHNLG